MRHHTFVGLWNQLEVDIGLKRVDVDTAPFRIRAKIQTPHEKARRSVCQNVCQLSRFTVDVLLSVGCHYHGSPSAISAIAVQTKKHLELPTSKDTSHKPNSPPGNRKRRRKNAKHRWLLRKIFPEKPPEISTCNSSKLQLLEVGRRPQLWARVSIDVWENVWGKFGICQHDGPIPSKVLAKVYRKGFWGQMQWQLMCNFWSWMCCICN